MISVRSLLAVIVPAALCLGSVDVWAATIAVANPSFESLPVGGLPIGCGLGCAYSIGAIPGWVNSGPSGEFQPGPVAGNFTYYNYVPDGVTVAYAQGNTISQTIAAVAQAGVTYTLSVDVGYRKDFADLSVVDLVVGGNTVAAVGIPQQFSGNWSNFTAVYSATAADAGAPISINLSSGSIVSAWDNVRLSSNAAVPEPAAWTLMLVGLGGLGGALRSRRRSVTGRG